MSACWEGFAVLVGNNRENSNSPVYRLLIDHFPVQFMLKLLSMIDSGSSQVVIIHAAMLLTCHVGDILEERYSAMDIGTIKTFQNHVVRLLNSAPLEPEVQKCALVMASKLLTLSLQYNQVWREFLELTAHGFTYGIKFADLILEIFCQQHVLLQHKFTVLLKPHFRERQLSVLLKLLGKGEDYKPFMILPSISQMLTRDRWSVLMEAAIMSPFFDRAINSLRKCQVASSLRFCIEHSTFDYSSMMVNKIKSIIFLLLQSSHDGENRMATKLCSALLASCFPESLRYI